MSLSWKATKMMMCVFLLQFATTVNALEEGKEYGTVGVLGEAEWMANFGVSLDFSAQFARWEYILCGLHLHLTEV